MMKYLYTCVFILAYCMGLAAQSHKSKDMPSLQFGLKAGATYSKITNLDRVLVSETYYSGYKFNSEYSWGSTAGVYINYKLEETISAFYSELSYSRLGSLLKYSDVNAFNYTAEIKYDMFTWELFYKAYVTKWLPIGVGPRLGLNLTPDALVYTSNGQKTFGPDIRVQQDMRDVLKGRTNVSFGVSLGLELTNGLSLDFRYYHGLSDVIETLVNNYKFIEDKNASRSFQVTLGYALPYTMKYH